MLESLYLVTKIRIFCNILKSAIKVAFRGSSIRNISCFNTLLYKKGRNTGIALLVNISLARTSFVFSDDENA
jgi:hypothetical protein